MDKQILNQICDRLGTVGSTIEEILAANGLTLTHRDQDDQVIHGQNGNAEYAFIRLPAFGGYFAQKITPVAPAVEHRPTYRQVAGYA